MDEGGLVQKGMLREAIRREGGTGGDTVGHIVIQEPTAQWPLLPLGSVYIYRDAVVTVTYLLIEKALPFSIFFFCLFITKK